mmetsp:Transcript_91685/g.238990  ORF Transcript_91685/g.238990 Transcript_91685/m.238990 type:complete len:455 (+) Transcript_91685:563-1927(+)
MQSAAARPPSTQDAWKQVPFPQISPRAHSTAPHAESLGQMWPVGQTHRPEAASHASPLSQLWPPQRQATLATPPLAQTAACAEQVLVCGSQNSPAAHLLVPQEQVASARSPAEHGGSAEHRPPASPVQIWPAEHALPPQEHACRAARPTTQGLGSHRPASWLHTSPMEHVSLPHAQGTSVMIVALLHCAWEHVPVAQSQTSPLEHAALTHLQGCCAARPGMHVAISHLLVAPTHTSPTEHSAPRPPQAHGALAMAPSAHDSTAQSLEAQTPLRLLHLQGPPAPAPQESRLEQTPAAWSHISPTEQTWLPHEQGTDVKFPPTHTLILAHSSAAWLQMSPLSHETPSPQLHGPVWMLLSTQGPAFAHVLVPSSQISPLWHRVLPQTHRPRAAPPSTHRPTSAHVPSDRLHISLARHTAPPLPHWHSFIEIWPSRHAGGPVAQWPTPDDPGAQPPAM